MTNPALYKSTCKALRIGPKSARACWLVINAGYHQKAAALEAGTHQGTVSRALKKLRAVNPGLKF